MSFYPMQPLNGLVVPKKNRQAPSSDFDQTPRQFRRYMGDVSGLNNVQLHNGLQRGVASGLRYNYRGTNYMWTSTPKIPGQTRDNMKGYHKRGPSPLNVKAMFVNGPGSQPENPGGPGKIAAPQYINPGRS